MREIAISTPKTNGLPVSMPRTSTSMLKTYGPFVHLTDSRNENGAESNRACGSPLLYGTVREVTKPTKTWEKMVVSNKSKPSQDQKRETTFLMLPKQMPDNLPPRGGGKNDPKVGKNALGPSQGLDRH